MVASEFYIPNLVKIKFICELMKEPTIKIIIIGESGVGKSSLLNRFVADKFDELHDVTIGMDFKSKVVNFNGVDFRLALWDTAGCERFRSLSPSFYRNALGAILVYDVTNRESLVKLDLWLTELDNFCNNANLATIIVGNKIDKTRTVSRDDGLKFARKHRALFIETSAKSNEFVGDVFRDILEKIVSSESFDHSLTTNTLDITGESINQISNCKC